MIIPRSTARIQRYPAIQPFLMYKYNPSNPSASIPPLSWLYSMPLSLPSSPRNTQPSSSLHQAPPLRPQARSRIHSSRPFLSFPPH
ncbi:hypothetical protein K461DRAFT_120074 [Myriangium duriaei CBS 260.36]|uniref:Uncharacterized protein n=1 Tax=Myriangium duriaei CBS 260.36 TaxID=1168546 RepID=A0A9P4MLA0_9PEZI|nr:hypothetical protein K461DRAFT_120074 [Myriangium duriaei CBS 260.36]